MLKVCEGVNVKKDNFARLLTGQPRALEHLAMLVLSLAVTAVAAPRLRLRVKIDEELRECDGEGNACVIKLESVTDEMIDGMAWAAPEKRLAKALVKEAISEAEQSRPGVDQETMALVTLFTAAITTMSQNAQSMARARATAWWTGLPRRVQLSLMVFAVAVVAQRLIARRDSICEAKPAWCERASTVAQFWSVFAGYVRAGSMMAMVALGRAGGRWSATAAAMAALVADVAVASVLPWLHRGVTVAALAAIAASRFGNFPRLARLELPLTLLLALWLAGDVDGGALGLGALGFLLLLPVAVAPTDAPRAVHARRSCGTCCGALAALIVLFFGTAHVGSMIAIRLDEAPPSPLYAAAGEDRQPALIALLTGTTGDGSGVAALMLEAGADVHVGKQVGPLGSLGSETPLRAAAEQGHAAAVEALLTAGADPQRGMTLGPFGSLLSYSPLSLVAKKGHAAAVEALLTAGADPQRGMTLGPFGSFGSLSTLSAAAQKEHAAVVAALRNAGAA